jgi:hypothetical protein
MPSDERGPGPSTIERVVAAWQRAQAGLAADDNLVSDETVVTLAMSDAEQSAVDVDTILRRMVRAMLYASLRETEAKELKNAMQQREQRYKARGELLRRDIFDILILTQRERFVAPEGTTSLRDLGRSVVILDLDAIPDEYVTIETVRHPDKRKMANAMEQGVVITGATLSNGGQGLSFRRARSGDGVRVD